ncbi:hydroxymethylbilane synthase [Clostridium sp. D2Q-11]|uniref:Porphobilinogen deaminase n=1 Tax=Anaeromonas frigoriresistens TaxID=2683708 RepID=A0A942Z5X3_9FIRM|nr:hydroxymethylbilane synthase [Anaeromonas frigoriresistens]MBS4537891.1 hydroxymethylbilane synthase [Anaeromonas frigoriresistens]
MKIVVGSRGSKLALSQTNWVIDKLRENFPKALFEVKVIKTKGDKIQNVSLDKIGDKGLFVKEIEKALLQNEIDLAIHSFKDMPSELPKGLIFAGVPKREDYRDVLILREGLSNLKDIPIGGKIGTGSKRRKYQFLKVRPDIKIVPIRGNIDSRIRKIDEMNIDGIILAAAGIKRLGLNEKINYYFNEDEMLPAPSQGALALEIRKDDIRLKEMIEKIRDEKSAIQVKAERAFLEGVNGSCHIPIGALCIVNEEQIILNGLFGSDDGSILIKKSITGNIGEEEKIGKELADEIMMEMRKYEG